MDKDVSGEILEDFDAQKNSYQYLCQSVANLMERLLAEKGISVHSISYRCKDRESLSRKIAKKAKYKQLSDITDLAGVRIITHYQDDVDAVANLIKREFSIDRANSIDKRESIEPDRFGYMSLHYVASISKSRAKLQEYSSLAALKFEFQVRSILQHSWAEIEHDIGYKSELEVPGHIRRKFSRLAGLLELADLEFSSIRKDISKYSERVGREIRQGQLNIAIDSVSFAAFITTDTLSLDLDSRLCRHTGHTLLSKERDDLSKDVERLYFVGIKSVEQLSALLKDYEDIIWRVAVDVCLLKDDLPAERKRFNLGISSFYLCHILAAKAGDAFLDKYMVMNGWTRDHEYGRAFMGVLKRFR